MRVYFDKENIVSYIRLMATESQSEERRFGFKRLMKRELDLYFNCKKEELLDDRVFRPWITTMADGRSNDIVWLEERFPKRPLSVDMVKNFSKEELMAIYLLKDDMLSDLSDKGVLLMGAVGDELKVLSKLYINRTDNDFCNIYNVQSGQFSWAVLNESIFPCAEIVLIDRYVFTVKCGKEKKKGECEAKKSKIFELNLFPILRWACLRNKTSRMNIIVFTQVDMRVKGKDVEKETESNVDLIKKNVLGFRCAVNVTIILCPKNQYEHDRFLITNYLRLKSGDSFKYFGLDEEGKMKLQTHGAELDVACLASRSVYKNTMSVLQRGQDIINGLQRCKSNCIIGDKISRVFSFK